MKQCDAKIALRDNKQLTTEINIDDKHEQAVGAKDAIQAKDKSLPDNAVVKQLRQHYCRDC